jgi:hypothetical protein
LQGIRQGYRDNRHIIYNTAPAELPPIKILSVLILVGIGSCPVFYKIPDSGLSITDGLSNFINSRSRI